MRIKKKEIENRITASQAKSKIIHGGKYNYERVTYKNNRTDLEIMCPEHELSIKHEFFRLYDTGEEKLDFRGKQIK